MFFYFLLCDNIAQFTSELKILGSDKMLQESRFISIMFRPIKYYLSLIGLKTDILFNAKGVKRLGKSANELTKHP